MIFFSALDLGRPPSKVLSGSSGTWSECTVRQTASREGETKHRDEGRIERKLTETTSPGPLELTRASCQTPSTRTV